MIVIDMDMPKSCSECPLSYDYISCIATGSRFWSKDCTTNIETDVLPDCPIGAELKNADLLKKHRL